MNSKCDKVVHLSSHESIYNSQKEEFEFDIKNILSGYKAINASLSSFEMSKTQNTVEEQNNHVYIQNGIYFTTMDNTMSLVENVSVFPNNNQISPMTTSIALPIRINKIVSIEPILTGVTLIGQIGLDIDGENPGDQSGISVSISANGSIIAIGTQLNDGNGTDSGHVRIFQYNGSSWSQLGNDIDGEASNDQSGNSISLSADGNRIAIGATLNNGNGTSSGHVRVFQWDGTSWSTLGNDINGEVSGDQFGHSVILSDDGNRVAAGSTNNDGNGTNSGHVRIFQWNGSGWSQLGSSIYGQVVNDKIGAAIAFSSGGNRIAIGARMLGNGEARVYEWNGSSWTQVGSDIIGENASDRFGVGVSISSDGTVLSVGAHLNDGNGISSGHVRVFKWNGSQWDQRGSDIDGEAAGDQSGTHPPKLSADGNIIAIRATKNDGNGTDSGHVRIFKWNGTSWVKIGNDIDGENSGDNSGHSVDLSADGTRVIIGATLNDGNGTSSGHARIFQIDEEVSGLRYETEYNHNLFSNGNFLLSTYEKYVKHPFNIIDSKLNIGEISLSTNTPVYNSPTKFDISTPVPKNAQGLNTRVVQLSNSRFPEYSYLVSKPIVSQSALCDIVQTTLNFTNNMSTYKVSFDEKSSVTEISGGHPIDTTIQAFRLELNNKGSGIHTRMNFTPNQIYVNETRVDSKYSRLEHPKLKSSQLSTNTITDIVLPVGDYQTIMESTSNDLGYTFDKRLNALYVKPPRTSSEKDQDILIISDSNGRMYNITLIAGRYSSTMLARYLELTINSSGGDSIMVSTPAVTFSVSYDTLKNKFMFSATYGDGGNPYIFGLEFNRCPSIAKRLGFNPIRLRGFSYYESDVVTYNENPKSIYSLNQYLNTKKVAIQSERLDNIIATATYNSWTQFGTTVEGTINDENLGFSVAMADDGGIFATSSVDANTKTGYVEIYQLVSSDWFLLGQRLLGDAINNRFGTDVALSYDGKKLAVGSQEVNGTGYARVYAYENSTWSQIGQSINISDSIAENTTRNETVNTTNTVAFNQTSAFYSRQNAIITPPAGNAQASGFSTNTVSGSFQNSSFLTFGGHGPGQQGSREAILNSMDLSNVDELIIRAIRGTGSNGGETPDSNEQLKLQYNKFNNNPTDANWTNINSDGTIISNTNVNFNNWNTINVTLPSDAKRSTIYLKFLQTATSHTFDHWGVLSIKTVQSTSSSGSNTIYFDESPSPFAVLHNNVSMVTSGSGSSRYGFNTQFSIFSPFYNNYYNKSYLRFGDGSGSDLTNRHAILNALDLSNSPTVSILAIRGNNRNGGEIPDNNEDLKLQYNLTSSNASGSGWTNINSNSGIIISRTDSSFDNWKSLTINLPSAAQASTVYLRFQQRSTGVNFDHWGILSLEYTGVTTTTTSSAENYFDNTNKFSSFINTSIVLSGTGSNNNEGFNTASYSNSKYLRFGDDASGTENRYAILNNAIDLTNSPNITLFAIKGSGNGGESPEVGEDLKLQYNTTSNSISASWQDINDNGGVILGSTNTSYNYWNTLNITIPSAARNSTVYLRFNQQATSFDYDNFGLLYMQYTTQSSVQRTVEEIFIKSVELSHDGSILAVEGDVIRLFEYLNDTSTWVQLGSDIIRESGGSLLNGSSISLSKDGAIIALGEPFEDSNGTDSGKCRIFEYINGNWTQIGSTLTGEVANDRFGFSVDLSHDGKTIAVGANGNTTGYVKIYKLNSSSVWTQKGSKINGQSSNDKSGTSVSLSRDGNIVAIGAPENNSSAGQIRVYDYTEGSTLYNGSWNQIGADINGPTSNSLYGRSLAMSSDGKTIVSGATGYPNSNRGSASAYRTNYFECFVEETPSTKHDFAHGLKEGDIIEVSKLHGGNTSGNPSLQTFNINYSSDAANSGAGSVQCVVDSPQPLNTTINYYRFTIKGDLKSLNITNGDKISINLCPDTVSNFHFNLPKSINPSIIGFEKRSYEYDTLFNGSNIFISPFNMNLHHVDVVYLLVSFGDTYRDDMNQKIVLLDTTKNTFAKLVFQPDLRIEKALPQMVQFSNSISTKKIKIKFVNQDLTVYKSHGNQFTLSLSFSCII